MKTRASFCPIVPPSVIFARQIHGGSNYQGHFLLVATTIFEMYGYFIFRIIVCQLFPS